MYLPTIMLIIVVLYYKVTCLWTKAHCETNLLKAALLKYLSGFVRVYQDEFEQPFSVQMALSDGH